MSDNETLVYTSGEAMKALKLSKDTFWQLVHAGVIPGLKVSDRKYLFSKNKLQEWVDRGSVNGYIS